MDVNELSNAQGQLANFGLYNCVDPYAKAQVRVIRLKKSKAKREKSRMRTVSGATSIRLENKEMPSNNSNLAGKERYFR